ncbi:MAG TPA: MlaD family protein [Verrucomicrobiae bacterium]|nr:MlaD family protein [Verrucomicrobiae bacterium]
MKIRFNSLLLGVFFIGGVGLAIMALLGLGSRLFHPAGHFVFYLPRSAGGLDEGSGVRLDGVRVGQVEQICVYYDQDKEESFVGVICEIDKNLLTDPKGHRIRLTDSKSLRSLVSRGLFAQVQTAGLVGTEYVELGFNSSTPAIAQTGLPASPYPVVPTVPATLSELTGNISEIVSNLHQIDYHGIVQQINGVLTAARGQIDELQTNRLTDHLSNAAQSVGNFMNSPDLRQAVGRLKGAITALQSLETNLNAQIAPTGTNLNETLESARESAESLEDFLNSRNQMGEQTEELMNQLNQTAHSIEQLSDFLQQHPNALITGRTKGEEAP